MNLRFFHSAAHAGQLLLLGILALVYALAATPLIGNLFRRLGLLDQPGTRKIHLDPIPRAGGIALLIAYAGSFATLWLFSPADVMAGAFPLVVRLLPAATLIFLTGLLDDLVGLRPWQKLFPQLIAAAMACWAGVTIQIFPDHPGAALWNVPMTILWLVVCTNAFNLIDGLDGLAAGVGFCAAATMLFSALVHHNFILAALAAPLAGGLLGFLKYNFNPASVFLGDCGSLLLGFLLGCFGVLWSLQSTSPWGLAPPLILLAIPLLDVALAVARRFLTHQSIFSPDKSHIHHQLLKQGFSAKRAALALYACCGFLAALSLLWSAPPERFSGAIIVVFCAALWLGIQRLGYIEFVEAWKLVRQRGFEDVRDALSLSGKP